MSNHVFLEQSSDEENNVKLIQLKLGELINNITKFEGVQPAQLDKTQYKSFMSTNNDLITGIEEVMRREMGCSQEDNKAAMLRFQKVLTQQKKKMKTLSSRCSYFFEEEKKYYDAENESTGLLQSELGLDKFEDFESIVQDRNQRIATVLKGMHVVNQVCKDIALMAQEQSDNVLVIHKNVDDTEENVKKANKELMKAKHFTGINRKDISDCLFSHCWHS